MCCPRQHKNILKHLAHTNAPRLLLKQNTVKAKMPKEFQPHNTHHRLEHLAAEGDFMMLGEVPKELNGEMSTQEWTPAECSAQRDKTSESNYNKHWKRKESGIFFSCLDLAPLWNQASASNAFLCSGKQCYALCFLKLGWRKYPCSPCVWCHSSLVQEAGNLAYILGLRGLDFRIPASQKSPVTTRSVLLGRITLHPSCWRLVGVSCTRSRRGSKRRVNTTTPDAMLSWGGRAAEEMGYSYLPKSLGYRVLQQIPPAAALHCGPYFSVQRTDSKAGAFWLQTL